jgi:hypothetical protein
MHQQSQPFWSKRHRLRPKKAHQMNSSCVYLRRTFSGHESGRSVRLVVECAGSRRERESSPNSVRHIAARNGKAGCLSAGANAAQPAGGCNSVPLLSKTAAVCAFLYVYVCLVYKSMCVAFRILLPPGLVSQWPGQTRRLLPETALGRKRRFFLAD